MMAGSIGRMLIGAVALLAVVSAGAARAQSPSSEAQAAAKELVETMHLDDQLKAILPTIIKNMKPTIVQGRAEVGVQYDALVPVISEAFRERASDIVDAAKIIYARNFSIEDLHALTAFYKTDTGQRLLQKLPVVTQELMTAGSKFGQSVASDVRQRMIDELHKKGVDL